MADVKIEFTIGDMKFVGEGDNEVISAQLDKILRKVDSFATKPQSPSPVANSPKPDDVPAMKPLPPFLEETGSKVSQVRKFLACAVWLQAKHGKTRVTTREVTEALRDASQSRLGNPADCLRQNIAKGHCEKIGNEFYVTEEGRKSILGA